MKFSKAAALFTAGALFVLPLTAEEKNPLQFSVGIDGAYYPKTEIKSTATETVHRSFAPITGIFSKVEGRGNLTAEYTIDTPLGKHWLLKDADLVIKENLEVTPISVAPSTSFTFTPLPFLVFETGFKVGTGWPLAGTLAMAEFSPTLENPGNHETLSPFSHLYSKYWLSGTFQFDTGAIVKGDWTHVQTLYTYQVYYEGMSGMADKAVWKWQSTYNKVNGLKEAQTAILAYQMPLVVSRVGIMFESDRYYSDKVYDDLYKAYNGSFREMNLSLLAQFSFTEKDLLSVLFNFANRRTYEVYNADVPECVLTCSGSEWFFRRIAFSYTHTF